MKARGIVSTPSVSASLDTSAVAAEDVVDSESDDETPDSDSFMITSPVRLSSSPAPTAANLARVLETAPRIETSEALETRVGEWLQSVARGEKPTTTSLQALRQQVTAHGVLALVVIEAWEQAIAADLDGAARTAFHSAVASFLGERG